MKGFTLVELLGVVIILGILSVIATPTVENIVINSKEKAYETQIKDIEKASNDYLLLYPDMAPSNNKVTIYLNTLKKLGLIDKNIKNPKTGKLFSNITSITISKENNMYVFDIKDSDLLETDINENTPILSVDGEVVDYVELSQSNVYNIPTCNAVNPSGVEGNVNCTYQILNNDTIDLTKVGSYQIVYEAVNDYGKSVFTKTVVVKDTTKPIISVENSSILMKVSDIDNYMNNEYLSDITITDNSNLETTINISTDVTKLPGKYYIKYIVTDKSGNSATYTMSVTLVDDPKIIFNPSKCKVTLTSASDVDNLNSNLNNCVSGKGEITYEGTIGKTNGTYSIVYTITDSYGFTNTLTQTFKTNITPSLAFDDSKCATTLTSLAKVDKINNKLTTCVTGGGTISYEGTINRKRGTYNIVYTVTDAYGNTNTLQKPFTVILDTELGSFGDIIYYDPVNNIRCTTYVVENSKTETKEGCLRWYVLSGNDDNTVNLILDHNIVREVGWNGTYEVDSGPMQAVEALNNAVKDIWSNALIRSDSYSHGVYNMTKYSTYTIDYSGMKARLPEAGEIAKAVGKDTWDENSVTKDDYFYFSTKAWLYNNLGYGTKESTQSCLYYGCEMARTEQTGDYGYWTSTIISVYPSSYYAWCVRYSGELSAIITTSSYDHAVRPVITVPPTL